MNPRLQKLEREISRTKDKIAELQGKLADMESQKVDIENTEYISIARSLSLAPHEFEELVRQIKASRSAGKPTTYRPGTDGTTIEKQEDMTIEG